MRLAGSRVTGPFTYPCIASAYRHAFNTGQSGCLLDDYFLFKLFCIYTSVESNSRCSTFSFC